MKDDKSYNPVVEPISLSTIFHREDDGGFPGDYSYTRRSNPNRSTLEAALAALEGGDKAACFSSGSAAIAAVFLSLETGDHVILPDDCYHGTRQQLTSVFKRWNLTFSIADYNDVQSVEAAINEKTKILWLETPTNPLMKIIDLEKMAAIARKSQIKLVVDNTVATPMGQQPFSYGADLVVHSTTKFLNGHSDVLGGVVIGKADSALFERVREVQLNCGAVPSPYDCWMVSRGLRTFPLRFRAQSENALAVATFLSQQSQIETVFYPGLKTHKNHEVAARQMQLFGGLMSFQVKGGEAKARALVNHTKALAHATSLGGVETVIEHRASMEGPDTKTPVNLVRLSVGVEPVAVILKDLEQALSALY